MSRKHALPVFSITLILSAFLLFSVQPMFAKMILPLLGGSPSVWNTAMVFFQTMLLLGYGYAHITSRWMTPRTQAILHIALLALCALTLPLQISANTHGPESSDNPLLWQLGLMGTVLAAPFLVLSGTAPMMQRWFSSTVHPDAHNPYFLYAASNIGSLAALLLYPTLIEMMIGVRIQASLWSAGYIALITLVGLSALMIGKQAILQTPNKPANDTKPSTRQRLQWIFLAFIPSSLMLSVTTYITTDIASIPLLWIFPLTLYLLTFIIAFARRPVAKVETGYLFQCTLMVIMAVLFIKNIFGASAYPIFIHLTLFFLCALCSHLALAAKKPPVSHLTEFYLLMSLGGVLGGMFNVLIAPIIFPVTFEYPLGLLAAMSIPFLTGIFPISWAELKKSKFLLSFIFVTSFATIFLIQNPIPQLACVVILVASFLKILDRGAYLALTIGMAMVFIFHPGYDWSSFNRTMFIGRNFYGTSKVFNSADNNVRIFMNGTTVHGEQALIAPFKTTPLTYYYPEGPVGDALRALTPSTQHIGILGLGTGSVACYEKAGRSFDFYEIDPLAIQIALDQSLYTYLSTCGKASSTIIEGDARLKLMEAPDHSYDAIMIDVFSSDSIPVHMITKESFDLYFQKLSQNGVILMNISNRHLNLKPLIASLAETQNAQAIFTFYKGKTLYSPGIKSYDARYAVVSRNSAFIEDLRKSPLEWAPYEGKPVHAWTDDYANFISLIHFGKE